MLDTEHRQDKRLGQVDRHVPTLPSTHSQLHSRRPISQGLERLLHPTVHQMCAIFPRLLC